MTIKECIQDSLEIKEGIGRTIVFEQFLMNMSAILLGVTAQLPEVTSNPFQFLQILLGESLLSHSALYVQLKRFMDWYLEQDREKFEDGENLDFWYDAENIGEAWNEFAMLLESEKQ